MPLNLTPDRYRRLLALLDEALEQDSAGRDLWLNELGPEDADLIPELRRLLANQDDSGGARLDAGAGAFIDLPDDAPISLPPGHRIGNWTLLHELGRGGMGVVWLAERADQSGTPPVALKLATTNAATRGTAERLAREGAILAALNHAHIARLIEIGAAEDGTPYLALEYIEGQPLPAHCDAQTLDVRARLKLFIQVLDAVAYAHAMLVLHRDLKPGNVFVTRTGDVKLLDFGIAKLLDVEGSAHATELTRLAGRALTPDYASPEQIAGRPLTVASDLYALGVMLFELLTGDRPYKLKRGSAAELEEAILTADPQRPSTVVKTAITDRTSDTPIRMMRRIDGELDTIVLKCLKKKPEDRYLTVSALKDDIERYLGGRPVLAQPDSFNYRARKFLVRNWLAASAATSVVLALVIGLAAALWQAGEAREQARIANAERARAEQRFNEVRSLTRSLIFEVHDAIYFIPGATDARNKIVQKAIEFLDKLAADPMRDAALTRELATGYERIAQSFNSALYANIGDAASANRYYAKALALLEPAVSQPNVDAEDLKVYALIALNHGVNLLEQGDVAAALAHTRRGRDIRLRLLAAKPDDLELHRDVATADSYLANVLYEQGDLKAALAANEETFARFRMMAERDRKNVRNRWGIVVSYANTANMLIDAGDLDEAKRRLTKGIQLNRELEPERPNHYSVLSLYGAMHHLLGDIAEKQGDRREARSQFEQALRYREGLAAKDAKDSEAAMNLASTNAALGAIEVELQATGVGLARLDKAIGALRLTNQDRPGARRIKSALVRAMALGIQAQRTAGKAQMACTLLAETESLLEQLRKHHGDMYSVKKIRLTACRSQVA